MNYLRMLVLAVAAAAALSVSAGNAFANPLTSPAGTAYTSTLKATSTNSKLHGSFITVECSHSSLEGKVESHTPSSASGNLSSLGFSGCNYPVTALKPGSLKIHAGVANRGTVTSSGAEISIHTSVGTCVFTSNGTDIGTLTDTTVTKGKAVLDLNSAQVPRTGGSFFCGSWGTWTGSYEVTTPTTLYVDSGTSSTSPLTSPEGKGYTSTIKAEAEGATKFDGTFTTVECAKSSLEANIEGHDFFSAEGQVSSLTFGECNYAVEVLKPGSLKIHAGKATSGTVTWSNAEIRIVTSAGTCTFPVNGVDIGTITGSNLTKGNATLDLSSPKIPSLFGCGGSATWTGSYKVTTPSTLYLHGTPPPTPAGLTSPANTPYTSTLKAESEGTTKLHFSSYTEECSSSFEGKVESHTATTAAGALSSLSFSGCTYPITVLKTGTLDIHSTGSGTATVTSTGTEISMETPGGTCIFTTSSTDIGTLTDSSLTKGNATLDLNSAKIPRTGGNFLCGEFGTWTGSFKVTTPSTLYVDA